METCPKNCSCVISPKIPDLIDIVAEMETGTLNKNHLQSLVRLHTDLILYQQNCLDDVKMASLKDIRKHLRPTIIDLKIATNHPLANALKIVGLPE